MDESRCLIEVNVDFLQKSDSSEIGKTQNILYRQVFGWVYADANLSKTRRK